ncbi:MAG TPA: TadG family pilus assembly protein [Humisphaera sp.]
MPLHETGPRPPRPGARSRRGVPRGTTLIYMAVAMVAFAGFCSLAVDWGRVTLVKTELQAAADAAARAAGANLGATASSWAISTAGYNTADGTTVVLQSSDVELGQWDTNTSTFTPNSSTYDAVRVTARRTVARGNPVRLTFGGLIGISTCDVTAVAVAALSPTSYGVVGLNGITMSGNSSMGYTSGTSKKMTKYGSIASNGNITLSGSTYVYGDARPGIGMSVIGGSGRVAGKTTPLTTVLSYPNADGSAAETSNNNGSLPGYAGGYDFTLSGNQSVTLSAGTYYARNVSVGSNNSVICTGPVTIYCWGTFNLSGSITTASNTPANLTVYMCPGPSNQTPGSVNISSNGALYMQVYAPQSAVNLSGTGDIYGSVLGKTVSMSGTSAIYYDIALEGGGILKLVQ